MVITMLAHVTLVLIGIFPLISMMRNSESLIPENYQVIEIAFENGDMSPASASTKPLETKEIEKVIIEEQVEEIQEKQAVKETTVLKNEEISFEEEVPVEMKEGSMNESVPVAEKEVKEVVEEVVDVSTESGDSDSEAGEGEVGEAITGYALANMDFEGEGVFGRKIIYHANISRLAKKEGRVVVNLCINRAGNVTHIAFNKDASSLTNSIYVREVMRVATKYRFEADYTAPKVQCGKLTFIFEFN